MSTSGPSSPSSPHPQRAPAHAATPPSPVGITIVGTGAALPERVVTNADLMKVMDTSDEWIMQRTGIRTRHRIDRANDESTVRLGAKALTSALASAKLAPIDLDLIICATMTPDMLCPPSACMIADRAGATRAGAFDLNGACSGFVFGLNVAHDLIKVGASRGGPRTAAVIGADTLSTLMDYSNAGRSTAIIFGDGAGAAILRATDDPRQGVIAQGTHCDGSGWKEIFVPTCPSDFPPGAEVDPAKFCKVQMNGASVFKFAVGTFSELIAQTLDKAGLLPDAIDLFVCHQSNARILNAARDRFGIPEDKLYINIDRVGNTVGASVPLCLDDLNKAGRVKPGMKVMFVAFGGGLTWGSSLWQL
jgi:3-oxoacyl-[acyl-carrier-protein] synthase III